MAAKDTMNLYHNFAEPDFISLKLHHHTLIMIQQPQDRLNCLRNQKCIRLLCFNKSLYYFKITTYFHIHIISNDVTQYSTLRDLINFYLFFFNSAAFYISPVDLYQYNVSKATEFCTFKGTDQIMSVLQSTNSR